VSGAWEFGWSAVESLATAGAAAVAVTVWIVDGRRRNLSRARAVTSRLEVSEGGMRAEVLVANHADLPAYDVSVHGPPDEVDALPAASVLYPGEVRRYDASPDLMPPGVFSSDARMLVRFTIDGHRWAIDSGGSLRRRRGRGQ
jgi:hypothetical protein